MGSRGLGELTLVRGLVDGRCAQQVPNRNQLGNCHSPLSACSPSCVLSSSPRSARTQPRS